MAEIAASLEIQGNLTWTDLQRFYYFVMLRGRWVKALLWIAAFLTIAILAILYEWHPVTLFLSLLFAGQHAYVYVWAPVNFAKAALKNLKVGDPVAYSLTENGIHLAEPNLSMSVDWAGCKEVYETRHLFIVYLPHNLSHQIPKRFFDAPEQVDTFRGFLAARIPAQNFRPAGLIGRWC